VNLIRRTVYVALSASLAAGLTVALSGPAAHAVSPAVTDQSCTKIVGAVVITPGLTFTDKSETYVVKGKASGCSAAGKATGRLRGKFTVVSSCANFPNPFTVKVKAVWADTTISVMKATFNVDLATLTATITGKVVNGPFTGDQIHNKEKFTLGSGDCSDANPIKTVTFANTNNFTFTHA
jgi:hypothetical protein